MNNGTFLPATLLSVVALLTICNCQTAAQDIRAFNQNASRSNHTRLSFSFSPTYSTPLKNSTDSLLFRGNGTGFRVGADYYIGKAAIGFNAGFSSSSPDNATINNFLKRVGVSQDQLQMNKANQQNMYLLIGPSVRFGRMVEISAHAKGGLFINNGGLVNIQQRGAQRAAYRNEATDKSVYPGFITGVNVQYNTNSAWSFGFGADYMTTKTEVNNYDIRRGGGTEGLKLSRNITDMVAAVTIRYNIHTTREAGSGLATGRRSREAGSGIATGRRTYQPGQPVYGNIAREAGSGMATGRRVLPTVNKREIAIDEPGVYGTGTGNCGPVTTRITYPDGTTEEMTFSCPDDAATYSSRMQSDGGMPNRISMNTTVPKQTQGATFGEKVNQGLHAAGSALSQGRNILSGRLTIASESSAGIITNKTAAVSSVGNLSGAGSGAAAASYARMGAVTTLYARETGSGQASGRREKGSGLATGRRQYQPVFSEEGGTVCDPCLAKVSSNPLFQGNSQEGANPLHKSATGTGNDCDGIAGIVVSLLDPQSGALIARTTTEACGDFFFANIPDGDYIVDVSGSYLSKKGYDYYKAQSDMSVLGRITLGSQTAQMLINTGAAEEMTQKAGISTSRSNIRTKSLTIIDADTDGDGTFESTKVLSESIDGTIKDITASARVSNAGTVKKVTVRGWDPEKKESVSSNGKELTISINGDNNAIVNDQPAASTRIIHHPNVVQYVVALNGTATEETEVWSPRSNIRRLGVSAGDMDGDGRAETIIGGAIPGANILSAARVTGDPIHGVDVKLGNTDGKIMQAASTNEDGEFEFTNLTAEKYLITVEQTILIKDQAFVSVGDGAAMQSRAQDHNSSRSNKTASAISSGPDNGSNTGGQKVQDHNSSRSNKSSSIVTDDTDNNTSNPSLRAQNNNTVRSNRTDNAIIINDNDSNTATTKTINTSRSNIKNMIATLDELELQLNNDQTTAKAIINTSRSNIKNQRAALSELDAALANKNVSMKELEQKSNAEEKTFSQLLASLKHLGTPYSSISNVLKTKHDTAKNAIGNIR